VKIVADSSPLITLAKIAQLEILPQLYRLILITPEVYGEVAVTGAGLAGAAEIAAVEWIQVHSLKDTARLAGAQQELGLGIGEVSAILLAIELGADAIVMDDRDGRKAAWKMGVDTIGCVGVLEEAFRLKLIPDLRAVYRQLFVAGAFVSRRILEQSLKDCNLPPL
jgi:predicted nucleic acid-binding protein